MNSNDIVYEKCFIYFDTNVLECRSGDDIIFLSEIKFGHIFYEVIDILKTLSIQDKVDICIPEIVLIELKNHMIKSYKSRIDSFKSNVDSIKKTLGQLIDVNYTYTYNNLDEYEEYVDYIINDFINNPRFNIKIIFYPRTQEIIDRMVFKATHSIKPFIKTRTIEGKKKEYSDAGFKDAMICETIIENTKNELGILISNDSDMFSAIGNGNLFVINSVNELKDKLIKSFGLKRIDSIEKIFKENEYIITRILNECDIFEYKSYSIERVIEIKEIDEILFVKLVMFVDDIKYLFEVNLDIMANEIVNADCYLYNEDAEYDD